MKVQKINDPIGNEGFLYEKGSSEEPVFFVRRTSEAKPTPESRPRKTTPPRVCARVREG
jgi:hypothetical protein